MQTTKMRQLIREAAAIEAQTGNLKTAVSELARVRGVLLNANQRDEICKFIREYIEHAPAMMEQIALAARNAGILAQVEPILQAAEEYFFAPFEVIPDHFGLLGLVDDAYLTHSLIQAVSNWYRERTGTPLLPQDFTPINLFMRGLIGEPHASMLDSGVFNVLQGPLIQQVLLNFLHHAPSFTINQPDPIWGNASAAEIADARLGALGIGI